MSAPGGSGDRNLYHDPQQQQHPQQYPQYQQQYPQYQQQYPQQQYADPITGQPVGPPPGPTPNPPPQGYPGTPDQGFSEYPPPPGQYPYSYPGMVTAPPPKRSRGPLIAGISVAAGFVAVVLIAATAIFVGFRNDSSDASGPVVPPEPKNTPSSPASPSPSGSSKYPSQSQTFVPPLTPGWKGVAWPEFGVAYDIPPTWNPKPGSLTGVESETGPEKEMMSAYSIFQEDVCGPNDGSFRSKAGIKSAKSSDAAKTATDTLNNWARLGFTTRAGVPPLIAMNPVAPVKIDGGRDAVLATAMVTPATREPCNAPTTFISVVALSSNGSTAMLVGVADQDVPGATPPPELSRVMTSLRWLPK